MDAKILGNVLFGVSPRSKRKGYRTINVAGGQGTPYVALQDLTQLASTRNLGGGNMARKKVGLGAGARLADYLSTGLLARAFPVAIINEELDAHHCNSERVRTFPASAVVYYTMALSLYSTAYEAVFAAVAQGLARKDHKPVAPVTAVWTALLAPVGSSRACPRLFCRLPTRRDRWLQL